MTQEARPHRPADDAEEVYFEGSPMLRGHLGQLLGFALAGVVLIAIPIVIAVVHSSPPTWVWILLILLGLLLMVIPLIVVRTIRYRISNYRINFERGLLSKTIDTLELWHVEDLKFQQSLLNRILGVGRITIISHDDTTPTLHLHGLPNPRELFNVLQQRIIAVKRQRGVLKMNIPDLHEH